MSSSFALENPSLGREIYQSVDEYPTPTEAEIIGSVPKWLKGALIRVGPGKLEWGDYEYKHWFDGDAILNRFEIENGEVKFSSRFLRSQSYVESEKKGCIAFTQFGTLAPPDPCKNIFSRFFSYYFTLPEMTDNCNVNIVKLKGSNYASTEAPKMWQIDETTLESLQIADFTKALPGPRSWLAHPHYDDDGAYYNCSTAYAQKKYQIVKVPARKTKEESVFEGMEVVASFPYQNSPGYFHSFSMTENYFLFIESSLLFSNPMALLFMKIMDWSYSKMFQFHPNIKSKLHLIERKSGKVAGVFKTDAFMCFHQINAFETSSEVVFDMCGYTDAKVMEALYLRDLRAGSATRDMHKESPAQLRRYHLPLDKVDPEKPVEMDLDKAYDGKDYEVLYTGIELPRINYGAVNGKDYIYTYGMSGTPEGLTKLIKVNTKTRESWLWEEENCNPSEPVFIPSPNAEQEDDGVVLSAVLGVRGQTSFLLILDGATFKEKARANVSARLVPLIHGEFLE